MKHDTHGENGINWTGFDLDGTLAEYDGWHGIDHIGKPIKPMCDLMKKIRAEGQKVKILTARVAPRKDGSDTKEARKHIEKWCEKNLGFVPEITHEKDSLMDSLYDDRAIQVIPNTGIVLEDAVNKLQGSIGKGKTLPEVKALLDYLSGE